MMKTSSILLGIGLLSMGLFVGPARAAEVVHHWAFDGDTSDDSGSGNDGDVYGSITYTNGRFGQALVIDDLDDLVENQDASNLPTEPEDTWSMNVWYNLERFPSLAYGGGFGGILDNGLVRSFLSFGPGAGGEDNAFYFWGSNIDVYAGEDYDTDGQWHMYTITFDGEFIRMYEDGSEVLSTDVDKQGDVIADDFINRGPVQPIVSVGGPSNWNENIEGAVDEFTIWRGALSGGEIEALFAGTNGVPGDFDNNGVLDAADIDSLTTEVRLGNHPSAFDLDGDSLVTESDRVVWVKDLRGTWFGDANLDDEFTSSDLVDILAAGTYEANVEASWTTGDFDGSGRSDSGDLVVALADGGYEMGPRQAVPAVPEPMSAVLMGLGLLSPIVGRARSACRRS